ncbi:hypothetical protein SynMITS9220_00542 [Synechococcus sp. MIT S9220]|nr:hypothetical protein SynMITS9220_00542 [Synechococcus sp. MIT S9220]
MFAFALMQRGWISGESGTQKHPTVPFQEPFGALWALKKGARTQI